MPLLNLRDVAEGTPLRTGMLLRSAQPHRLTTADTDRLAGLLGGPLEGLRLVADLRSEAERAGDDWTLLTDLGVRVTRLGTSGSPADLSALPPGIDLGDLYVLMLDHRTAWFASVVAEIADGLPALVHCAAGKDRTGLVVALILDLVGVEHEVIVRDYAATATHLPQIITMLGLAASSPAKAVPSAEAVPTGAVPLGAVPAETVLTEAVPARVVSSVPGAVEAVSSTAKTVPSGAVSWGAAPSAARTVPLGAASSTATAVSSTTRDLPSPTEVAPSASEAVPSVAEAVLLGAASSTATAVSSSAKAVPAMVRAISGLLDAPEAAIRTFLTALDARGGAERLLTAHGLTVDHVQRLRAALVG
ncbi:tyrosine-protein phosphatase [Streptosporangium saharense]|uniref:tyrosine-protein phosphatase n=1 Tax=Streptosporangium saharense TaxID=1706840 RepID=UPI0034496AB6